MRDFTPKEYKELRYICDKLSRMCMIRYFAYGCVNCPLFGNDEVCAYLLLDKRLIQYQTRCEHDYS